MADTGSSQGKGYEVSDVQMKVVLISGLLVVSMTLIAYVVSVFFIKYLAAGPAMSEFEPSPMAGEYEDWDLPVRLQVNPPAMLTEHKEDQAYISGAYGVVSDEPEIYRIPIETAMDIVSEHGLPTFTMFLPPEGELTEP